jgi:hypothetical protein
MKIMARQLLLSIMRYSANDTSRATAKKILLGMATGDASELEAGMHGDHGSFIKAACLGLLDEAIACGDSHNRAAIKNGLKRWINDDVFIGWEGLNLIEIQGAQ